MNQEQRSNYVMCIEMLVERDKHNIAQLDISKLAYTSVK